MSEHFPLTEETHQVLGACFEVYNELGCGFLEPVYHEALEIELGRQDVRFESQKVLNVTYKGKVLDKTYQVDFVCFGSVIVEIKAVSRLTGEHRAQILNYLHATDIDVGLLVNFGHYPQLEYERFLSRRLSNPCLSVSSVGSKE
jgi:GxxExxY protein